MPPSQQNYQNQQAAEGKTKVDLSALTLRAEKRGGGAWKLMAFSFMLLAIASGGYFGLDLGYRPYLEKEVAKEQAKIDNLLSLVSKEDQLRFRNFYYQLLNLQQILGQHIVASKILPFFQDITLTQVTWEHFTLNVEQRQLSLTGYTKDYVTLVQQLDVLQANPHVLTYTLENVGTRKEDNKVTFGVRIIFDTGLLKSA